MSGTRGSLPLFAAVFALISAAAITTVRDASAHALGVSNGDYGATADAVTARWSFARAELAADGESAESRAQSIARAARVTSRGAPCRLAAVAVQSASNDGVAVDASFSCAEAPRDVTVALDVFPQLTHGHRHLAHAVGAPPVDAVLHANDASFSFTAAPGAATASDKVVASPSLAAFVRMGVEHILTGYDHLLFLFALVVVGGRLRSLFGVVTAFTVAHSLTLALAAFGLFEPSPRWIEPLIALSIAYVGIENFFVKDAARRWRLTFAFGLIHGFGFAGALREANVKAGDVPAALLGFNVGVEAGQLAVMAALLPLVLLAKRWRFAVPTTRALSGAVVLAGLVWFLERTLG